MENKVKKVLFTATVDSHILHFHIPYLKMFKDEGYEVHVATNGNKEIPYCDKKHVVSFERSPFKTNNLKAIKQLKKIINEEKLDIIHCHTPMGSVVTRIAAMKAKKKGTRVIYTAHGFHFYKGAPKINWLLFYPIEKWLSRYTDTLITINQEDYDLAKRKFYSKHIELVHGVGVDPEKFNFEMSEEEKDELRKEIGIDKDDFVMICVGELNDNKNQIMQIEAMREIVKENKNIKLILVGEGDKREFLEHKIQEYNLQDYIKLLGYRTDVPRLLKISNLALSTSKREGLPVNVIEALTVGLPVIGTNCRGTRDLIIHGKNGRIVDIGDKKIEECIKDFYKININTKVDENILEETYSINILSKMDKIYFKKKKIFHILSSNKYSGAENVVCTIIKNSSDKYDMYYISPEGPIKEKLNKENINYIGIKKMSYFQIMKLIKQYKPDVIHAHDFKASCISALFKNKCKIISHIHGNNKVMNRLNLKSIAFLILSKNYNKIIYVSSSSLNDYYFFEKVKHKSIVLYNVIDERAITEKAGLWKCEEKYDLIFLGRLAYPKDPFRLIEIVKLIVKEDKNIMVAVVGNGVDKEKTQELVEKYNLVNNVKFYGFVKNPFPILANSKLLIMTSVYEGTPMCALEAQCMGIPIASTPVDGLTKIIKNNYNGFLSSDNKELAKNILRIIKDKDTYEKMKLNTIELFRKYNDLENYVKTIEELY